MLSHQPALRLASFSDGLGRGFDVEDSPTPITSGPDPLVPTVVVGATTRPQLAHSLRRIGEDKSLELGVFDVLRAAVPFMAGSFVSP